MSHTHRDSCAAEGWKNISCHPMEQKYAKKKKKGGNEFWCAVIRQRSYCSSQTPQCWHSQHPSLEYPTMLCCRGWLPGYSVVHTAAMDITSACQCVYSPFSLHENTVAAKLRYNAHEWKLKLKVSISSRMFIWRIIVPLIPFLYACVCGPSETLGGYTHEWFHNLTPPGWKSPDRSKRDLHCAHSFTHPPPPHLLLLLMQTFLCVSCFVRKCPSAQRPRRRRRRAHRGRWQLCPGALTHNKVNGTACEGKNVDLSAWKRIRLHNLDYLYLWIFFFVYRCNISSLI